MTKKQLQNNQPGFMAWAMEPIALNEMISAGMLSRFHDPDQNVAAAATAPDIREKTAIVPVYGILLPSVPSWMSFFGIKATSYAAIRAQIHNALENDNIDRIALHIDSPGGQVIGCAETGALIAQAATEKKVVAHIEGMGASAAYWLASQATEINASQHASIGSIGVRTVLVDSSQAADDAGYKFHMIATGEHKGTGEIGVPITENQLKPFQEMVNEIGADFLSAVTAGRGKRIKAESEDIASGRVWLSAKALEMGLIDGIKQFSETLSGRVANQKGSKAMSGENTTEETKGIDIDAIRKEAATEAIKAEQTRVKELCAAFPDDPDFAMEQTQAGSTVAEAKANYCDVLSAKLEAATAQIAEHEETIQKLSAKEKAPAAKPVGAAAVESGESEDGEQDFLAVAKERAKEDKISVSAAMSLICKEQPELHSAYLAKCRG